MANSLLAEAALKAIQDKQFNAWLKGIGEEGLKLIKKLFLETAEKDLKLKAMALEDPLSTMILFAYQVYQLLSKQSRNSLEEPLQEEQNVEPEEEELEDMNNPPLTSPISAKFGAKLNHIIKLNGHCPEGYEILYYSMGGHLCGKCRKKKQMLMLNMACGGKKRIKKGQDGLNTSPLRKQLVSKNDYKPLPMMDHISINDEDPGKLAVVEKIIKLNGLNISAREFIRLSREAAAQRRALQAALSKWQRHEVGLMLDALNRNLHAPRQQVMDRLDTPDMYPTYISDYFQAYPEKQEEMKALYKNASFKPNGEMYMKTSPFGYKKGGKTLTKAKANSLKYKGGPGDINSTEGMKPNKKQKKMLTRKVGGMVKNAEKITIYGLPDMFDYVKY